MEEKQHRKHAWKKWVAAAAALVFIMGGTLLTRDSLTRQAENGMTGGAAMDAGMHKTAGAVTSNFAFETARATPRVVMTDEEVEMEEAAASAEQKIIRTASFTLKTTDFEQALADLQALVDQFGGRAEYQSQTGDKEGGEMRTASLTLRIPANRLDEFLSGAENTGRVTALTQEREDVSDSYYDLETRLQTQQAKMRRLLALMEQAQSVSELIELESAIAETQYCLDSDTGSLQRYDSQINYSTVRVSVREIAVAESQEISLGRRIAAGLQSSLQAGGQFLLDALVFFMAALPWLLIVAIIVIVTVRVRKGRKGKEGN